MTIVRWEPFRELSSLQSEMNRLFDTAYDPSAARARRWAPAMDLVETAEQFVLRADLPGVDESDIKVELEDNVLTVSGERRSERESDAEGVHRVERQFGSFARSLALPRGVDPEAVTAAFDRGVLEVRISKPEQRKPRRIEISGSEAEPATLEGASA